MKAYIENGKIVLEFAYNPFIISKIKLIKGREYNSLFRVWYLPYTIANIEVVKSLGFDVSNLAQEYQFYTQNLKLEFEKLKGLVLKNYPFLFDYQAEAIAKGIISGDLLIADEMGLGKSLMGICIADYHLNNSDIKSTVVCCPQSIKWQWKKEIKKWLPKRSIIIIEGTKKERHELYNRAADFYIINYEQTLRDFDQIYTLSSDGLLILDEATKIKNPKAKRTKLIQNLKPKYTLALTGTPVENKLSDVFTIANIIKPGWMSNSEFYNYCVFEQKFGFNILTGYKNIGDFMERLMEVSIRRKRKDVAKMPERVIYDRFLNLTPTQRDIEEQIIEKIKDDYNSGKSNSIMQEFVLLPMLENSVELIYMSEAKTLRNLLLKGKVDDSPKLKELMDILQEVNDEKIVIFSRFKRMVSIIAREIQKEFGDVYVIGTGDTNKQQVLEDFEHKKQFLIATDAFSYGVDMPYATTVINFDIHWNPAKLKQRTDRIYRVSSKKDVRVINLISEGLETYMYEVMNGKDVLFEDVMGFNIHEQLLKFMRR